MIAEVILCVILSIYMLIVWVGIKNTIRGWRNLGKHQQQKKQKESMKIISGGKDG